MPAETHRVELERRHQAIDRELQEALKSPSVDDAAIQELKRKKLALKDRIESLKH